MPTTQRLYYTDSYACEFQRTVRETTALGDRPAAVLALGGGCGGGDRILQGAAGPADRDTLERALAEAAAGITRAAG